MKDRETQHGQALIFLLGFLPLMLTLLLGGLYAAYYVIEHQKMEHLCQQTMLRNQGRILELDEELIALNPLATFVRWDRFISKAALELAKASRNPALIGPAYLNWERVLLEEWLVNKWQQAILLRTTFARYGQLVEAQWTFAEHGVYGVWVLPIPSPFEVTPRRSQTPNYLPKDTWTEDKAVTMRFYKRLNFDVWPESYRPRQDITGLSVSCTASVATDEEEKWHPTLIM